MDRTLGPLLILPFFAMRLSCEYLTVKGDHHTNQLRIQDLRFLQGNTEITGHRHRLH